MASYASHSRPLDVRGKASDALQDLGQASPIAHHAGLALLLQPSSSKTALPDLENAARLLHVELRRFDADTPGDLELAFRRLGTTSVDGILCIASAMFWNERARVVDLAARTRLPTVYPEREYVDAGGLMSYGPNVPANFYRAATYVDKILKGARPGDLPIEEPSNSSSS